MRNIQKFQAIIICVTLALVGNTFVSCKNKCGTTTCSNGGVCNSNKCSCPTGYYGSGCQTGYTTQLLGTYTCTKGNCNPSLPAVNSWQSVVAVAASNGGYTFTISNFDNSGVSLTATTDSSGSKISTSIANGVTGIYATGKFVAPVMTLRFYKYSSAAGIEGSVCDMTLTKL